MINATGTVLHTNLGRAPISREHMARLAEVACGYSNLEYDLEAGRRGERYSHFEKLLCRIDQAAKLVGQYEIVTEEVAKKALPECNIVCVTGEEMQKQLSGYLKVLYDANAESIGGSLPEDEFYYSE